MKTTRNSPRDPLKITSICTAVARSVGDQLPGEKLSVGEKLRLSSLWSSPMNRVLTVRASTYWIAARSTPRPIKTRQILLMHADATNTRLTSGRYFVTILWRGSKAGRQSVATCRGTGASRSRSFNFGISLAPSQLPPHPSKQSYRAISDRHPRDIYLNSTKRCLGPGNLHVIPVRTALLPSS